MEQGSEEWRQEKVGRVGCSKLGKVLSKGKGAAPSKVRKAYMMELLCERLTGKYKRQEWHAPQVDRGVDMEAIARAEYEARNSVIVLTDPGREHPTVKGFGCSPDGLIGDEGGLEIKCPDSDTHLETLLNGTIDHDYILQMAGGVLVYGRRWWDFVSYDDRLPEHLAYYCRRFRCDELPLEEVTQGVILFLSELEEMEAKLRDWIPRNDGEKSGTL